MFPLSYTLYTLVRSFLQIFLNISQGPNPIQNSDVGLSTVSNQVEREDAALFSLLNSARVWSDSPLHTTSGYFTKSSFYDAIATLEKQDLIAQNVLLPSRLLEDFENEFPGALVRTREFSSGVTHEGQVMGVTVYVHAEMPPTSVYVLPAPEFLGIFAIRSEDEDGENELELGMAISNPKGIATLSVGFCANGKG